MFGCWLGERQVQRIRGKLVMRTEAAGVQGTMPGVICAGAAQKQLLFTRQPAGFQVSGHGRVHAGSWPERPGQRSGSATNLMVRWSPLRL